MQRTKEKLQQSCKIKRIERNTNIDIGRMNQTVQRRSNRSITCMKPAGTWNTHKIWQAAEEINWYMYTYRWCNMHTICNNYSECIKFYISSFRCVVRNEVWFPEICEIEIDYYLKCNILNVSSVNSSINILNKRMNHCTIRACMPANDWFVCVFMTPFNAYSLVLLLLLLLLLGFSSVVDLANVFTSVIYYISIANSSLVNANKIDW